MADLCGAAIQESWHPIPSVLRTIGRAPTVAAHLHQTELIDVLMQGELARGGGGLFHNQRIDQEQLFRLHGKDPHVKLPVNGRR